MLTDNFISVVIPAAGASRRLGQAKQLVRFSGKPLLQLAIELAETIQPLEIIVVTGAAADEVQASIERKTTAQSPANSAGTPLKIVENPDWKNGIGSSIAIGMAAVSQATKGAMVLLCDQWNTQPADLHTLKSRWLKNQHAVVVSDAGSFLGPPVIFPWDCFAALSTLSGDKGARGVIHANLDRVLKVRISNASNDLDTPEDLKTMRSSQHSE